MTDVEPRTGLTGTWQIPAIPYIEEHPAGRLREGPQARSIWEQPEKGLSPPNLWKTLLHPADRDRVLAEDQRCDQTLEPWRCTYRVIARDGRTVWLRDEAEIVYDDNGEPSYWHGVYFDITDHSMAQRETTRRLAALDEQKNTLLTAVSTSFAPHSPRSWEPL